MLTADVAPFGMVTSRLPEEIQVLLCKLMGLTLDEGLPIAVECDDIQLLKALTLGTDSVMAGTPDLVRDELRAGTLHPLAPRDLPAVSTVLGVVSLRGRTLSPVATYAVEFLARLVRQQQKGSTLGPPAAGAT